MQQLKELVLAATWPGSANYRLRVPQPDFVDWCNHTWPYILMYGSKYVCVAELSRPMCSFTLLYIVSYRFP